MKCAADGGWNVPRGIWIERAKYLLEHSEKSIAEVAKSCGYGSANALRKVFAAETGKNPLVWRKRAE